MSLKRTLTGKKKVLILKTLMGTIKLSRIMRNISFKRLFDILFSFSVLMFGFPLFLLIALLLLIPTRGRILFFHKRSGKNKKPFFCYKFRTMVPNADDHLAHLLKTNSKIKEEWECTFKLSKDPRITFIGHFLRKTSLDELPQFFNVLKGEMSIVGPRPVTPEEIDRYYGEKAEKILSVPPGITGPWQTSTIGHASYEQRVQIDEEYVNQKSFVKDLSIIFKTVPRMFCGRGV